MFTHRAHGYHKPGTLNKLEQQYANQLELLKRTGEVDWYAFEAVTFKLAEDTRYTPDFLVLGTNGELECHEVKGWQAKKQQMWWEGDAKVKIKVAAEKFPFKFVAVTLTPEGWKYQEF
jgi:hypothetical protein